MATKKAKYNWPLRSRPIVNFDSIEKFRDFPFKCYDSKKIEKIAKDWSSQINLKTLTLTLTLFGKNLAYFRTTTEKLTDTTVQSSITTVF